MCRLMNDLKRPFPTNQISWRIGNTNKKKIQRSTNNSNAVATKAQLLCYIDARDVMLRLDQVCGLDWQCKYDLPSPSGLVICSIGIKTDSGEWIWRANGAGSSAVEPEKGSASDAFKRAATLFGIGRYLYEIPAPWVNLNERGYLPDNQADPILPEWATPEGFDKRVASQLARASGE